jgi:hypothetical protein
MSPLRSVVLNPRMGICPAYVKPLRDSLYSIRIMVVLPELVS